MKLRFTIILSLLFFSSCFTRKGNAVNYDEIISEKYLEYDSLVIEIDYDLVPSCTESYSNVLLIRILGTTTMVTSREYGQNTEYLGPISGNIIQDIVLFEKKTKSGKPLCGGYGGGNGISGTMKINNELTKFNYCKDHWDGIGELLTLLRGKAEQGKD